jgi:hypothetical protein
MPSPIGHALGALAAGYAASRTSGRDENSRETRATPWREAAAFIGAGLLPDLDLIAGIHSQYTHSVGAVAVVLAVTWLVTRGRDLRFAVAVALAYASHPLLDWLGQDGTTPYGVMLLWPFDSSFHHSGLDVFRGISRRYWLPGFVAHNLAAVAWEMLILAPPALAACVGRRRCRSRQGTDGRNCHAPEAERKS